MTAELKVDGTLELCIEREFAYPPEKVFEAWLKPEQIAKWMGPTDEINVSNVRIDAVEGGSYHMQFNDPDCTSSNLNGVYQTIQRYTKLVFTWAWEKPADELPEETLVTVNFQTTDKGTKLTLLHQKFLLEESRDRHHEGWCGTMDKFGRLAQEMFAE